MSHKNSRSNSLHDQKFDLGIVYDRFNSSLLEEDDVHMEYYLKSYQELNRFFTLMGTIFNFVSQDLQSKIDILNQFLEDTQTISNFESVKKMIDYEKANSLLHKKGYISGSRTLLRLHRGLDFIREFLKRISDLKDEDNTSHACRDAYDKTLAKHHPFVIRTAARVAMYSLPNKKNLLEKVIGEEENVKRALEHLPKTLESTATVYDRIENLYTLNDLHNLP